jgi:hypothetical protein
MPRSSELAAMRVPPFKKHISAWSASEGSDFDLQAAIDRASARRRAGPGLRTALEPRRTFIPWSAKKHYHESGTMRWMNMALCRLAEVSKIAEKFEPAHGEFGTFLLALPSVARIRSLWPAKLPNKPGLGHGR